jgi:phage terminase large subunit
MDTKEKKKRKVPNPTGKGGFQERPHDINVGGAPRKGQSWRERIKKLTDMTRDEAIEYVGEKTSLGRQLKELPPNLPIKDALIFASIISYGRDPNAKMFTALTNREEGTPLPEKQENEGEDVQGRFSIPPELIAPDFVPVYRDVVIGGNYEYALEGGRGSTKSAFAALLIVYLLLNNKNMHAVVLRRVFGTVRDSVFSKLEWAISVLGLTDKFKITTSPLEMEYKPTGQKIYFRGADDAGKLKSISPSFGYTGILWFEEFDQFKGQEQIRNIVQSVLRGGDIAYRIETWNTPRTKSNWVHKYIEIPKEGRYHHKSNYLNVYKEWLGKVFLDEAEHLKSVNPSAYEHEYLGIANGIGGQVFENVELRPITDEEIAQFDRVLHGLDFGWYPDPAHYSKSHYDAARMTLYIFGEVRKNKTPNRDMYDAIIESGYNPSELLIADSAEPKSVADYRAYGANCKGAEKGAGSVTYRMKWMQSLIKIVIDPVRCPHTAQEFIDYEYERTKDGEIISEYPDKDNHSIDSVGYGTNLIWRRKGE